jgi:hypothetical protein
MRVVQRQAIRALFQACDILLLISRAAHGMHNEITASRQYSAKRLHKQPQSHRLPVFPCCRSSAGVAEAMDAAKNGPEPLHLRRTSHCASRGTGSDNAYPLWMDTRDPELFVCPNTSPPALCTASAPNASVANDQDIFTAALPVPSK